MPRHRNAVLLGKDAHEEEVYLPDTTRHTHLHIMGGSRRGKSRFMELLVRHDIQSRHGLCLIDPHGELYDSLVTWCIRRGYGRRRKLILIEPQNEEWVFGFNPLDTRGFTEQGISNAVSALVKILARVKRSAELDIMQAYSTVMPHVLRVVIEKGLTLDEALDLCSGSPEGMRIRHSLTTDIDNDVTRRAWEEFNSYNERDFRDSFRSSYRRIMDMLEDANIRRMVGQTGRTLDIRRCMDEGAIVLVNLAGLTDTRKRLLGACLLNSLYQNAVHRVANKSRPFYLYLDECHYYFNEDVARILFECAKFGLHLTLAHHNLGQLREAGDLVYSSVMAIENKVAFGGIPFEDAQLIADELFTFDTNKIKHVLDKPVVTGYKRAWLSHTTRSYGQTATEGATYSRENELAGETLAEGVSETHAEGRGEALVPIFQALPSATESLEEQRYNAVTLMKEQPQRSAIVKRYGEPAVTIEVADVSEAPVREQRIHAFKQRVFDSSGVAQPRSLADQSIASRRQEVAGIEEPETFLE